MKPLLYREVIRKLRRAGFILRRKTAGSHEIWWHEAKKKTCVVPHHREVRVGTLKSILRQADLTEEEFLQL